MESDILITFNQRCEPSLSRRLRDTNALTNAPRMNMTLAAAFGALVAPNAASPAAPTLPGSDVFCALLRSFSILDWSLFVTSG